MNQTRNFKFQISNSKIRDLLALALIVVLVLLFFWRIVTPKIQDRAIFPPGDFSDQFWMFRQYTAQAFAQGRLPLWSDNYNSGHPFLADVQSAVMYPLGLAWTLGVSVARHGDFTLFDLELEAIVHFMLAGAFTYLFARRVLGSQTAAWLSAITFTFGGYLTSYPPQQLAILETATWLPLILLLLDLAVERGMRYYLAAGMALGIAALAGHPQTFLFVGYASAIYFVWRVAQNEWRGVKNFIFGLAPFALTLLIGIGVSAAQYLPTFEYQMVSTRTGISWAEASRGFPTLDPLQMILPGFVSAFQSPLYLGVLPLWLAVFALARNRSREKMFWAWLALGALLVSFGAYAFAYAVLYLFAPGFALFRDQERLAFIVSFALALLAGFGARDLLASSCDAKRVRRIWALLPAGIVISLMLVLTLYLSGTLRQSGRVAFLGDRAAFMTLVFVLATGLIAARAHLAARGVAILIGALIVLDLFTINTAAYNAAPNERFPITPLIAAMQNDHDIFRVADEGKLPGHFGIAYHLEEIGGISPLRTQWYAALRDAVPDETLWRLLGVRYVITGRPGAANADVIAQDGETRLLHIQDALPRAWFVPSVQVADDQTALAAMARADFDPRTTAYLAGDWAMLHYPDAARNSARVIVHAPEHLVIAVNTPADAMLLISQNYYPNWQVLIDGVLVPTRRADVALIAVPLQKGAQRVELIFDPTSVYVGLAITLFTTFGALGGIVLSFWRGKRNAVSMD